MPGRRKQRVASQIRFEIADLLERRTEDPRLRGLSVTDVEVTPDLHQAFIYVSALSGKEGSQSALAGLRHAAGFFRHELAGRLDLRVVPELIFRWDASLETGERISHILDELAKSNDDT
jgi:ribosome-binding factor A